MILAGDEAQVQFATVGVRLPLPGPHGSPASPEGCSAFLYPGPCGGRRPIPPADNGASTFVPPASGGYVLVTPTCVFLMSIRI